MVHRAVRHMREFRKTGDVLMDAPEYSGKDLVQLEGAHGARSSNQFVRSHTWIHESDYNTRSKSSASNNTTSMSLVPSCASTSSPNATSTSALMTRTQEAEKYRVRNSLTDINTPFEQHKTHIIVNKTRYVEKESDWQCLHNLTVSCKCLRIIVIHKIDFVEIMNLT